jgi:hypothetical protein
LASSSGPARIESAANSQVPPSGGDFATAAAPMVEDAPVLFSMMTLTPSFCCSCEWIIRAMVSNAPPAAVGMMIRTRSVGHD